MILEQYWSVLYVNDGRQSYVYYSAVYLLQLFCLHVWVTIYYGQNALHLKLYGKSAHTSVSAANPTIIENPELLRLKEEECARAKAASATR